jgi:hypothetical protein
MGSILMKHRKGLKEFSLEDLRGKMEITVKILKWEKHNPRKDVKRPSWFALDNGAVDDDEFFHFNHGEFKAWIYLLSKASKKQDPVVRIYFEAAERKANISRKDFESAIEKLKSLGIVTVDVTPTLRESDAHVTLQTDRQTIQTHKTDSMSAHVRTDAVSKFQSQLNFDLVALFDKYPRHEKKTRALSLMAEFIQDQDGYDKVSTAIDRYRGHCEAQGTEYRHILTFTSWWDEWKDWLDEKMGKSTIIQPESDLKSRLQSIAEGRAV